MLYAHRQRGATGLATAILALVSITGCGSTESGVTPTTYPQLRESLVGSPPALAATHLLMGKVITSPEPSFTKTLKSLRGYPIVVNTWASWCGPCRYEFPIFGQASLKLGKRVGFLGIATRDPASDAREFLAGHPVGYPSWSDPDGELAASAGVGAGLPVTTIYDRNGRRSYIHQGPYRTVAALEADIARYGGLK